MSGPESSAVVVGAGLMGGWHAHALRALGIRVAGVVDRDADRAAALARRYRVRAATDIRTFLELGPHAVHICTPVRTHRALASLVLEAGAHVLIEKPFASTAGEAEALLDAAEARGLIACPVHQFRFQPGVARTVARLDTLGPLLHLDLIACSAGATARREERDRIVWEILPHGLDLVHALQGRPVDRIPWQAAAGPAGEWRFVGSTERTTMSLLISMSGRPTRNTFRVVAERGTVHLDLFHGFAVEEGGATSRAGKIRRPFGLAAATGWRAGVNLAGRLLRREPAYPGLRELIRRFHRAVLGKEGAPISADDTRAVARAADRMADLMGLGTT